MIVRQFGRPTGVLGRVAGAIMAGRRSNRERNLATVRRLDVQPTDRVLEIGFGPGLAIAAAAAKATEGVVVGIDHSPVMLEQAGRRNSRAIAAGRVALHLASVDTMPALGAPFDKVFAVNVYQFLSAPVDMLRTISGVMKPGATIGLTVEPRNRNATVDDTRRVGERMIADLRAAGFADVRVEIIELIPVSAACALARKPD